MILIGCNQKSTNVSNQITEKPKQPKNIILMVGDGMGLTQITAGLYSNSNKLQLERFTKLGLHKSYSGNNLVTDSAAGATAFSCGVKSFNGAIGVDLDKKSVKTILEMAEEDGKPTGLIATSTITHATPASFIAHVDSRQKQEEIAADFLNTEVDVFIGGGKKFFNRREDKANILDSLKAKNYFISDNFEMEVDSLPFNKDQNIGYFTSDSDPLPVSQGRKYLPIAAEKTISYLDRKAKDKGFFLMVEGSQIDWGGHSNEGDYIISEMLDFDKTIGKVLDFAEKDGETLVIVTADHETGGFAIQYGSKLDSLKMAFTSDYHTADLIPVFAFGPGAEAFQGIYENTAIFDKMKAAFGY